MTKKILGFLSLSFFIGALAFAGPWNHQDQGSPQAAAFAEAVMGNQWNKTIAQQYPGAEVTWGARGFPSSEGGLWVVYAEIHRKDGDPIYLYFEVTLKNITTSPTLRAKYGI